ncbi:MAG TPA: alpha-glucosidase [Flavisolibacter sp.]
MKSSFKSFLLQIIILTTIVFVSCQSNTNTTAGKTDSTDSTERKWWKEAVVYQVYPRSFKDANGDGVGDLKGIISKLDYLKSLGVDVIWLNPIFASPNADNGYDISDYRAIMKEFGTMDDFDALLKGLHARNIKLILDLVVNHSSDEHEWFRQSRSSRTNPYRDYYHWWNAERGKPAFRPGSFEADGSGWRFDSLTNAYYLHYFSYKQPDLNWENPKVRQEVYSLMKFWFDKGIDGFRMDVIPFIAKDTTFPVITQKELDEKYGGGWDQYFASNPNLHKYLKEMNSEVLSKYNCMSVGEGAGVTPATAHNYVDEDRHELNMLYHFEGVSLGFVPGKFKKFDKALVPLSKFKAVYSKWDSVFAEKGWGTIYLGNHDQPRMLSRWGDDSPQWRVPSSKMLTTFILTMRATPFYFAGDELGMQNIKFERIEDYKDIETIGMYTQIKNKGGDLQEFLNDQKITARDNSRTPFQWDNSPNAGFTTGKPWLKVNPDYITVNVVTEEKDSGSCLNYFKKLIQVRKNNLALTYGKYSLVDKDNPSVYAYTREWKGKKLLVLLNFTNTAANVNTGMDLSKAKLLIDNYGKGSFNNSLQPYEAAVYEL